MSRFIATSISRRALHERAHPRRASLGMRSALSLALWGTSTLISYADNLTPQRDINASATVAKRATLESLVEQADLIVRARVLKTWSPKTRGERGQIYTYTKLESIEVWHGTLPSSEVLLVQLGGQIGDLRLEVHGDAHLKEGQELVLFLKRSSTAPPVPLDEQSVGSSQGEEQSPQLAHLVSLAQSVFYVERATEEGPMTLRQDLDGIVFYEPQPTQLKLKYSEVNRRPKATLTLDQLKSKTRSLLEKKERAAEASTAPMPSQVRGERQ